MIDEETDALLPGSQRPARDPGQPALQHRRALHRDRSVRLGLSSRCRTYAAPAPMRHAYVDPDATDYDKVLPSFNVASDLGHGLVLRAAASQTMTRAQPGDIAPNQSLSVNGDVLTLGNPALTPYFSDNYDLGLEWYFGESGLGVVAVNVWQKKIEGYTTIVGTRRRRSASWASTSRRCRSRRRHGLQSTANAQCGCTTGNPQRRARACRSAPEHRRADHARWLGTDLRAAARLPAAGRRLHGSTTRTSTRSRRVACRARRRARSRVSRRTRTTSRPSTRTSDSRAA